MIFTLNPIYRVSQIFFSTKHLYIRLTAATPFSFTTFAFYAHYYRLPTTNSSIATPVVLTFNQTLICLNYHILI